ncbi:hypothetical protein FOA52_008166 [Chlamydomonas sp. UWO 241]|nr:hypothetical protein FOA52_008166 [Chlamydomonas sp. UWO 241]
MAGTVATAAAQHGDSDGGPRVSGSGGSTATRDAAPPSEPEQVSLDSDRGSSSSSSGDSDTDGDSGATSSGGEPPAPAPASGSGPSAAAHRAAAAAETLLLRLSRFRPTGPTDRRWQLLSVAAYDAATFQATGDAAAAAPAALLSPLTVQQLAYVAAAYAAASHPHDALMAALGDAVVEKLRERAVRDATAAAAAAGGGSGGDGDGRGEGDWGDGGGAAATAGAARGSNAATAAAARTADVGNGGRSLTLRSAAALAVACARSRARHPRLFSSLSAWLRGRARGGALRPRKRESAAQLASLVWAFSALRMYDRGMWGDVALLLQAEPRWLSLMDANDVLRLAWAMRSVGHSDEPLAYTLQARAATQVGKLSMGDLASAWACLASVRLAPLTLAAAMAKATRVKVRSLPPATLAATWAGLAVLAASGRGPTAGGPRNRGRQAGGRERRGALSPEFGLTTEQLLQLCDELATPTANKMQQEQQQHP